jgi:hypothetical protein
MACVLDELWEELVLVELDMMVVLLAVGRYLAELEPDPREADSTFDFVVTPYTSFLY